VVTPTAGPVATELLRRQNTALLLRELRASGPASRAALAQSTGLAKATVGTIVADLRRRRVVRDDEPSSTSAGADAVPRLGRPGRPVTLDGAHLVALGVEVNVDYVAATALDLAGRTVLEHREPLPAGASPLDRVVELARRSSDRLRGDGARLLGVAVAVPGLVDVATGHVVTAPNLRWDDVPLRTRLATSLPDGCPVRVDNDANAAAVAEASWGAARGCSSVLYLTGTVGLGAGLVADGTVQRGASGFAGEVGHVAIGGSHLRCACGRTGCWETTVGLPAMLRAVGMSGPGHEARLSGDPVQVAAQVARRAEKDVGVAAGLERVASSLAAGIATLVNLLDPQIVVLGGYFVPLGRWLLPTVEQAMNRQVLAGEARRCSVVLSTLGLHAASAGAAADVLGDVFTGSLPVPD
jgi:predicted NBD/HSP70 family sugar kinase